MSTFVCNEGPAVAAATINAAYQTYVIRSRGVLADRVIPQWYGMTWT